jgi:hypothetical protein
VIHDNGNCPHQGKVTGYTEENMPNETEILLITETCSVCYHCGALAFKSENV